MRPKEKKLISKINKIKSMIHGYPECHTRMEQRIKNLTMPLKNLALSLQDFGSMLQKLECTLLDYVTEMEKR